MRCERCGEPAPYHITWMQSCSTGRTVDYYYCEKHGLWEATLRLLEGYRPLDVHEHLETKANKLIEIAKDVFEDNHKQELTNMLAIASYYNIHSALSKKHSQIYTIIEVE